VGRHDDPVKRWKLSPIDLASLDKWDEYTRAKEAMFENTDVPEAPWIVIKSNDKKRARLEAMRYVSSLFDYGGKDHAVVGRPDPLILGRATAQPATPAVESAPETAPVPIDSETLPALADVGVPVGASACPDPADLV
jgi:hypothetical protein